MSGGAGPARSAPLLRDAKTDAICGRSLSLASLLWFSAILYCALLYCFFTARARFFTARAAQASGRNALYRAFYAWRNCKDRADRTRYTSDGVLIVRLHGLLQAYAAKCFALRLCFLPSVLQALDRRLKRRGFRFYRVPHFALECSARALTVLLNPHKSTLLIE